jgi:hypothetical protein
MTNISRTFARYHLGTHRHGNRSRWHDTGIALAIVLAVLVMAVAGSRGNQGFQSYHEWPTATDQAQLNGWEGGAPPELFPLSPLAGDELAQ